MDGLSWLLDAQLRKGPEPHPTVMCCRVSKDKLVAIDGKLVTVTETFGEVGGAVSSLSTHPSACLLGKAVHCGSELVASAGFCPPHRLGFHWALARAPPAPLPAAAAQRHRFCHHHPAGAGP